MSRAMSPMRDPERVARAVTAELLAYECDALPYPLAQYLPVDATTDELCRQWETHAATSGPDGLAEWLGQRLAALARGAREVDELVYAGTPLRLRTTRKAKE